jgi:ABC-type transport system involved in multi-copper enzyme maturation permease subunit
MLLVSPSTYVAAVVFLTVMGLTFTTLLESYTEPQETSPAVLFFKFFFVPVLVMVPLLTMKSISEERRLGTMETLLTTPVTTFEVVLGKFGAAYLLYIMSSSASPRIRACWIGGHCSAVICSSPFPAFSSSRSESSPVRCLAIRRSPGS